MDRSAHLAYLSSIAQQGFVVASVEYRTSNEAKYPAPLQDVKVEKLAIILGTEGEGLMPQTIKQSDYSIKIPMTQSVDSLNVAAASAVAFWELGNKEVKR